MDYHKEQSNWDSAIVLFFTLGKGFGNQDYFPCFFFFFKMPSLHDTEAFPSLEGRDDDGRKRLFVGRRQIFLKGDQVER